MVAGVVEVEVGADEDVDVVRRQTDLGEPVGDVVLGSHDRRRYLSKSVTAEGRFRILDVLSVHAGVDQDVPPVVGLDQIADDRDNDPLPTPLPGVSTLPLSTSQ